MGCCILVVGNHPKGLLFRKPDQNKQDMVMVNASGASSTRGPKSHARELPPSQASFRARVSRWNHQSPYSITLVSENEIKPIPSDEPLVQKMFHFRKEKVAALKSKANAQMGTRNISSLQAVMGHLWISITRARRNISNDTSSEGEASQEITSYVVLVGMRQRLHDLLSDEYTGNAVLIGTAVNTVGQLLKGGLGCAAMELNKSIASQTEQEARKFFKEYVQNPSLSKKGAGVKGYCFATGSSPKFDVYGNDFGWGKPVAVRSGRSNKTDGKLTVFAGAEEGSIDFEAGLSSRTVRALAEDEEFMQSLGV